MPLLDFLPTDGVMTDLSASSKKQLIENIAEHAGSLTGLSARAVFDALMQRERLGSTALGRGFAVPHARVENLDDTLACFFRLKEAVNFEAPDDVPVDLVFTIVIPEQATEEHLIILSSLARVFSNDEVCEAIRVAGSKDEIAQIIQSAED